MIKLTLEFGGKTVKSYEFNKSAITIGRELDNDIVIDNLGISRHHCKVEEKPGGLHTVSDLGSNNGTFMRGERITTYNLNNGDAINIGKYALIYKNEQQEQQPQSGTGPDIMDLPTMEMEARGDLQKAQSAPEVGPMTMQVDAAEMERMQRERASGVEAYISFNIGAQVQKVPLQKAFYFIGRGSKADFRTKGWGIAQRQSILVREATGYTLINTGKKSATILNGKRIDQQRLKNADSIKVGSNEFNYFVGKPV